MHDVALQTTKYNVWRKNCQAENYQSENCQRGKLPVLENFIIFFIEYTYYFLILYLKCIQILSENNVLISLEHRCSFHLKIRCFSALAFLPSTARFWIWFRRDLYILSEDRWRSTWRISFIFRVKLDCGHAWQEKK